MPSLEDVTCPKCGQVIATAIAGSVGYCRTCKIWSDSPYWQNRQTNQTNTKKSGWERVT